ncbi:MAG: ATP-binding cassette domain-containing protein [Oscillospiraceae bacterium]|nr:ATP-binding cassette domain-containing protein [Oscillospiraceae bacterium]
MCSDLKKSFGVDEILTNVSFILEDREKAALVGVNGAGKTSIFRMLTGEWQPDGGSITRATGLQIGYLPQTTSYAGQHTMYDELDSVFEPLRQTERLMRELERDMSTQSGNELEATMKKYDKLTAEFEKKRGFEIQSRIRGTLKGLGFTESQWQQPMQELSGGQRTRVALGKLLLTEPDLLLLDEPTNHLDIESIIWLEEYLQSYDGGVLIISHDRYFLDKTTTKTIEIENKKSTVYNGNYSFYTAQKAINRETAQRQFDDQQKEIKRQEAAIKTIRSFKTEAALIRAKSREKLLDKMERVDAPEILPDQIRINLTPKTQTGKDVLSIDALSMAFDDKELFENVSFELKKGDKTVLVGPNGVGKTTLFKIILGKHEPKSGTIREGANLHIGYYDQVNQNLTLEKTIFDDLADTYPTLTQTEIRNVLGAFLFSGDDVFKPISMLSGGERGRVSMAKIILGGANLLILDEPTNHLDMFSKNVMEQALRNFPGTILCISHDRYFINNIATKILEMNPSCITEYAGNYDDYYAEKQKRANRVEDFAMSPAESKPQSTAKNEWQRKKEMESLERKRKSRIERLENSIKEVEEKIADRDARLAQDEVGRNAELAMELLEEKYELEERLLELYTEHMEIMSEI